MPAGLQRQTLWGLVFLVPDPRAGEPDVGPRTLTPVAEPLEGVILSSLWVAHQSVWDLITPRVCPSDPHLLVVPPVVPVFSGRRAFLVGSRGFVDGCSEDSCDFGVLLRASSWPLQKKIGFIFLICLLSACLFVF